MNTSLHWKYHSYYFAWEIRRLYDGEQAKMSYCAVRNGQTLAAKNLSGIQEAIRQAEAATKEVV